MKGGEGADGFYPLYIGVKGMSAGVLSIDLMSFNPPGKGFEGAEEVDRPLNEGRQTP